MTNVPPPHPPPPHLRVQAQQVREDIVLSHPSLPSMLCGTMRVSYPFFWSLSVSRGHTVAEPDDDSVKGNRTVQRQVRYR